MSEEITRAARYASGLGSIANQALRNVVGNVCIGKAGLDIDQTNAENVETNADVVYTIDGKYYAFATDAEIDISAEPVIDHLGETVTASALATGYTRVYALCLDASGNIAVVEGKDVANGGDAYCPGVPPAWCVFGAVKVVNASGSSFTFGTTDLSTSGVTDTYHDLMMVPAGAL